MNNLDVARRISYIVFRLKDKNLSQSQKIELLAEYDALFDTFDDKMDLDKSLKDYDKYKHKTFRVRRKILSMMVLGSCSFLTLTFTNDVLNNTSEETRRRYVSRFLKSISTDYVANIDWGDETQREHYHAVVLGDDIDMSNWDKYGFSNCKKVSINDYTTNSSRMSKYIYKLSNHATKESTQRKKIIYSRDLRIVLWYNVVI